MSACLLSQRAWPAAVTLSWEANVRSLRGTHVALAHKQVLGGSLGSCAAQVMAPAELLLLVTWAPRRGRTEHRADRGWAMAGAPHTEAAESGRPEDPTSLENLPREPLPKQNTTWVDVRSKGKGKAEALGPRPSRMRCREAGCAMGTGKELPTGRGGGRSGRLTASLGPTQLGLTFGGLQLVPRLLEPASGMNVRGTGIDPEVVALGIPIEVQT